MEKIIGVSTMYLFDREYAYSSAKQISQIAEPSLTRIFGYDNADRLTSVTGGVTENYVFDVVGNRTSSHLSSNYTNGPFNKLTATQTANYSFDANGNTQSRSEGSNFWRNSFDYENQVTSVASRRETIRYVYDALGRRVRRHIKGSKELTKYTYDGQDVIMDDDIVSGITKYQNGPGIDNKLRQTSGSTTSYFVAGHLGSTNGLTNSSGALTASNTYDSFGNPTNESFPSRYQFTGREFDLTTGLQYSRARFYDPRIGRFVSEDPIGFAGGDMNLYGYVWNTPTLFSDPFGFAGTPANQPALWDKARREPQISRGLQQPPFQNPANLNPRTSESLWDYIWSTLWDRGKSCSSEIPVGRLPNAGPFKSGVPGFGEAITTLEMGPETYNTVDTALRRKHDIDDVIRCASGGDCGFTNYQPGRQVDGNRPKYGDLGTWEKIKCNFWGNCPGN